MTDARTRILFVGADPEDSAAIVEAGVAIGAEVTTCVAGDGRSHLEAHAYQLVVIDSGPDAGAPAVCRDVDIERPGTPILLLVESADLLEEGIGAGATDFASKPLDRALLPQRLRLLLRRTGFPAQSPAGGAPPTAARDSLTGLPPRALFVDRLEQALHRAARSSARIAVLHLDLDSFATINESLGRDVGDHLLQRVSERLGDSLRGSDSVARGSGCDRSIWRLGGDEFVILLDEIGNEREPGQIANRLNDAVGQPFDVDGTELFLTSSVGIALAPDDANDAAALMRRAQTAMGDAKRHGGNRVQFYSARMNTDAAARLDLAGRLHRGLAAEQFDLVYQPIFAADVAQIRGVEALLRWNHPQEGIVLPSSFVPVAEETGLILPLGAWVLERACRQWRSWLDDGIGPVPISINISARQFVDSSFVARVDRVVEEYGIDAAFLQFEITESVMMSHRDATLAATRALASRGIGLSVDDFGTGYSSLNYLRDFPADMLKIDCSFVQGLPESQESCSLVAAIVAMAHKLRLQVVAEGVETEAQLRFLRALDCELVQGFLLGRPAPPEELEVALRTQLHGSGSGNVLAFKRRAAAS